MSNETRDTDSIVSVKYCLASLKNKIQCSDKHDKRYLQFICEAITDINCFHFDMSGIRTAVINVTNNMCDLPVDFIDYIKIGYAINGRIDTFSLDDDIAIPITQDCGEDTNPNSEVGIDIPEYTHFGKGGGYNVSNFRIDRRNRRIIFLGTLPNDAQITIEYISSGVSLNEDTAVPREFVPAIVAYAIWQGVEYDERIPYNEKARKARTYKQELQRVSMSKMPTAAEMVDAIRAGYRQSPKR